MMWREENQPDGEKELRTSEKDEGPNIHSYKKQKLGDSLMPVDWTTYQLTTFHKNFYKELGAVRERDPEQVKKFRETNQIRIFGKPILNPVVTFEEAQFPKYIISVLAQSKFTTPTPIQSQGWPIALAGHNLVGIAATGSGKTLAYILPGIVHINAQELLKPGEGPIALVLAPTRELAIQIQQESKKYSSVCGMTNVAVYGGAPRVSQERELLRGVELLIATPGRLIDFLQTGTTNLRRVTYLVIDEADRLLDMGFEPFINKIVSQIRPDRHTLMWSATWPPEVKQLAFSLCGQAPLHINVGSMDLSANHMITQNIHLMTDNDKIYKLVQILESLDITQKALIFCDTKKKVDELETQLKITSWKAVAMHGSKNQSERERAICSFKNGDTPILIATDVASRGLDVKDISCVINYDFPLQIEDYVHRIGRTARAGATGVAHSFFTKNSFMLAPELVKVMEEARQEVSPKLLDYVDLANNTSSTQIFRKWRFKPSSNAPEQEELNGGDESSTCKEEEKEKLEEIRREQMQFEQEEKERLLKLHIVKEKEIEDKKVVASKKFGNFFQSNSDEKEEKVGDGEEGGEIKVLGKRKEAMEGKLVYRKKWGKKK